MPLCYVNVKVRIESTYAFTAFKWELKVQETLCIWTLIFFLNVESQHRMKKSKNMHLHLELTQDAVSRKKKIKVETCRICAFIIQNKVYEKFSRMCFSNLYGKFTVFKWDLKVQERLSSPSDIYIYK